MLTRRQLIKRGTAGGVGLAFSGSIGALAAPRPKTALTPFLDELPRPGAGWPVVDLRPGGNAASPYTLPLNQFEVKFHQQLAPTPVWGYGPTAGRTTHLSPTVIVNPNQQVQLTFDAGNLPTTHMFPPDRNLHPSDHGGVPDVRLNSHLHGSHVGDTSDGNPYAHRIPGNPPPPPEQDPAAPYEITPNGAGGSLTSQTMTYSNDQGPGLLWYHDHGLGITRQTVYAAAAGAYVIDEPQNLGTPDGVGIPLVIQDKLLVGNQLTYPGGTPSWEPEFFGDVSLVNGKIWPFMAAEPRWYRFRVLNASNARIYSLKLLDSGRGGRVLPFVQIANELGYLPAPVPVDDLVLAPAERADVLVDFREVGGRNVNLVNTRLPKGTVNPATKLARPEVMQFRVAATPVGGNVTPTLPKQPAVAPGADARVITHTLEEVMGPAGPVRVLLDGKKFTDPLSPDDKITNGDTVFFDIVNTTADTHPIHLHLVHFSVVSRQRFDVKGYVAELAAMRSGWNALDHTGPDDWMSENVPSVTPFLGRPGSVDPNERGYKDTVRANPGEVTRIAAQFKVPAGQALPSRYVWHCHILEHEDNDMMRPYQVVA